MKLINYISTAALMLSISACSNENDLTSTFYGDADAVRITAAIGATATDGNLSGGFTRSNPVGDAAAQAKFNSDDCIGITTTDNNSPGIVYTLGADGTAWTPADPANYLRWTTDPMSFYAYYPATEGVSYYDFTLPADQSTIEKIATADYMKAINENVSKTSGAIDLTFDRHTALVVIDTITFNDQYAGGGYEVSGITVHGNHTKYFYDQASSILQPGEITVQPLHSADKWYALLLPNNGGDDTKTFLTLIVKKTSDESTEQLTVKGIPRMDRSKKYTYSLTVGKKIVTVDNVTVEPWANGAFITGGEAETTVEASPATHTLTLYKAGALTVEHITTALSGGTTLTVNGTLNAADMAVLNAATSLTAIDLRGVNYSGTSGTLGTVPTADWSGCTNLTKILINTADVTAYTAAWSAATDKLFYPGKELTYKVEAMTGAYAGGIPCVVIGITDFDNYRLISRNPYCGDTDDGIYLLKGGKAGGLKYNAMTAIITPWGSKVATLADMQALVPLRPNSLTIITEAENGDQDIDLLFMLEGGFIVNSDGAQYVTKYTYDKATKVFTLGYQYDTPDRFTNTVCAFITFDVTNN